MGRNFKGSGTIIYKDFKYTKRDKIKDVLGYPCFYVIFPDHFLSFTPQRCTKKLGELKKCGLNYKL